MTGVQTCALPILHFKSSILDISFQVEFNFLPFGKKRDDFSLTKYDKYFYSPYIFAGLSLFSFNPKAELEDTWYDLHPLGTEGQGTIYYYDRKKYSLAQLAIPFGGGIKVDITEKINAALEWGVRKTFTDYIDDVSTVYADPVIIKAEKGQAAATLSDPSEEDFSGNVGRQRGNSKNKDWYSFVGLIITVKIKNKYKEQKCPGFNNSTSR